MRANGYPIHSEQEPGELPDGWAETKCPEDNKSRIFALDCEFCKSDDGQQLTRISIITFDGEVVYDTFVMPSVPITDYVTRFSGVTKELLEGVKTTLEDVQKKFVEIVSSNDILVGHSLELDLNVLKIRHPKIVDTSLCYHHARGPPSKPGLRWLCSTYLARDIQQGEASGVGHSSIEDAKACLDLVKLKIMKGMIYGTNYHEAPWLDKINQMRKEESQGPISQVIVDYEHHSNSPEFSTHYKVSSDEEVVDQFTRTVDQSDFFILSLRELEASKGWESPCKQNLTVEESYQNLSRRLNTIYSLLPENSLLVVSSIQGKDTSCITQLRAQRRALMQAPASNNPGDADGENESEHSIQTKQLADKLKEEVRLARKCVTFMTLKQDPFVVEN
jgi:RNA exonuclease 1